MDIPNHKRGQIICHIMNFLQYLKICRFSNFTVLKLVSKKLLLKIKNGNVIAEKLRKTYCA